MVGRARILLLAWLALGAGCAETVDWFTACAACNKSSVSEQTAEQTVYDSDLRVEADAPLALAEPGTIPEADLLDVDVRLIAPLRPSVLERLNDPFYTDPLSSLRQAESYYLSQVLSNKLQRSGHWGRIRLNPYGLSGADLEVTGRIEQSDGQVLRIRVEARDSSGALWLAKRYVQTLPPLAPRSGLEEVSFPFNDLLNAIANDLASKRAAEWQGGEIARLRDNSILKFAAELAPTVYAPYRQENTVVRLPAEDDPVFLGVQEMRMRNEQFLDAIQVSQEVYARQIAADYLRFLDRSRQVTQQVNDYYLEIASTSQSPNPSSSATSNRNVGPQKGLYSVALADVNQPIEEAVAPLTLEFSDHTAELSGTLENQFRQWQVILLDMYKMETGAQARQEQDDVAP